MYRDWLRHTRGLDFSTYEELWDWSRTDLDGFWRSVWDHWDLGPSTFETVVSGAMPTATWFDGAHLNYAQQIFRHAEAADAAGQPAIVFENERGDTRNIGWGELQRQAAAFALALRRHGIGRGDRVAGYLPNIPEAVIALLGCASLGAIWTMCSPDMGTPAVLDRFRQVAPKALVVVDGMQYGGKQIDRSAAIDDLCRGLPSASAVFVVRSGNGAGLAEGTIAFEAALSRESEAAAAFEPEQLPFGHPLWILYSSGTTGLPKAIVHGHGGVVVAACVGNMHLDLGPSYHPNTFGDRFHWYSATGWVMWNVQVGGLLSGTTICLYDGSPKGSGDGQAWSALWTFAARHRVTWLGAGAAFYASCHKSDVRLRDMGDLGRIRALGSTGSPLTRDTEEWGTAQFAELGTPDIWWCNISGGTDIAAAFLSGNRELPPTPGRLQCRHLGASVESWNDRGRPVIGTVGELVCTRPFPSMPLCFWGDDDGSRYRSTYFDEWDGIWRHGDWLTVEPDGSCSISGRSDATINRHGLRMGTAEIYAAVEGLPQVADTLIIDVEDDAGGSKLIMFVVPEGQDLDPPLEAMISAAIRSSLSPRFVPDVMIQASAIPRTLSGKKQELPMKRLFQGWPASKVIDPNLIEDAAVIPWYLDQARQWIAVTTATQAPAVVRASDTSL